MIVEFSPPRAATPWRRLARQLGLGRLAYEAWHRPGAALRRSLRAGGPWQQWLDERGRRAFVAAARRLPPVDPLPAGAPEVHLLTGRRFWYQSAFCLHSLRRHGGAFRPVFVDDGSFDRTLASEAQRVFPGARLLAMDAVGRHLDEVLPVSRFPTLRAQRLSYVHLRKLTDVHAGRSGARLVLDADLLFFREPRALLAWFASPDRPIHLLDVHDAYGYPPATLTRLAGQPPPSCVNVGVFGCRSEHLDWNQLEAWAAQLLSLHGTSYYLEQALVALSLAGAATLRLPAPDYRVMPDLAECRHPTAVMHHYVDQSKRGYFRHAWRHYSPAGPTANPA